MSGSTETSAMRRKAGAGRPAPEIKRMTIARAWRMAVPRAVDAVLTIPATALDVAEERAVRDALPEFADENTLIALLEGPDERFGVVMLDPVALAAIIEATTTGRVSQRASAPRPPTRTDAMIAADLLDALVEEFEVGLAEMDAPPNLGGYRYAAPLLDARTMAMVLADGAYSVFRLTLDLGAGDRHGTIVFAMPVAAAGSTRGQDVAAFQAALADNVMGSSADLDAVLHRVRMPLSAVVALSEGDVVRVPLAALGAVEIGASGGPPLAQARLGQQGGMRAVRITDVADAPAGATAEFEEAAPAAARPALPQAVPHDDADAGSASAEADPEAFAPQAL